MLLLWCLEERVTLLRIVKYLFRFIHLSLRPDSYFGWTTPTLSPLLALTSTSSADHPPP